MPLKVVFEILVIRLWETRIQRCGGDPELNRSCTNKYHINSHPISF